MQWERGNRPPGTPAGSKTHPAPQQTQPPPHPVPCRRGPEALEDVRPIPTQGTTVVGPPVSWSPDAAAPGMDRRGTGAHRAASPPPPHPPQDTAPGVGPGLGTGAPEALSRVRGGHANELEARPLGFLGFAAGPARAPPASPEAQGARGGDSRDLGDTGTRLHTGTHEEERGGSEPDPQLRPPLRLSPLAQLRMERRGVQGRGGGGGGARGPAALILRHPHSRPPSSPSPRISGHCSTEKMTTNLEFLGRVLARAERRLGLRRDQTKQPGPGNAPGASGV